MKSERVANYLAELRRLALTCEFGNFLDEALCDKFVCGLIDEVIQRRLLAEADLTLTKALTLAQAMETAKKDLKEIHPTGVESETKYHLSLHKQSQAVCHRCLGTGHFPGTCCLKSAKCNKCHKTGHIAKACLTGVSKQRGQNDHQHMKQRQQPRKEVTTNQVGQENSSQSEIADIVHVNTMSPEIPKSYKVLTEINGIPITMELDTGAGVIIVSEQTWSGKLKRPMLLTSSLKLHSYPSKPLDVLGSCSVEVTIHSKTAILPLVVVKGDGILLLGRNWLEETRLYWNEVAKINGIMRPPHHKEIR